MQITAKNNHEYLLTGNLIIDVRLIKIEHFVPKKKIEHFGVPRSEPI